MLLHRVALKVKCISAWGVRSPCKRDCFSLFAVCLSVSRSAGGDALLVVFVVAVFNSVAVVLTIIEGPLPSG